LYVLGERGKQQTVPRSIWPSLVTHHKYDGRNPTEIGHDKTGLGLACKKKIYPDPRNDKWHYFACPSSLFDWKASGFQPIADRPLVTSPKPLNSLKKGLAKFQNKSRIARISDMEIYQDSSGCPGT